MSRVFFQIYHGENKLHTMTWRWWPIFTRSACLVGSCTSSLKQQFAVRHVTHDRSSNLQSIAPLPICIRCDFIIIQISKTPDFSIILLSNLSNLSVPGEGYPRNASCAIHLTSTFDFSFIVQVNKLYGILINN